MAVVRARPPAPGVREQRAVWSAEPAGPFLLDVNVLIALIDAMHVRHAQAHAWLDAHAALGWATCPLTENGVLRIVSHPRYRNRVETPAACLPSLHSLRQRPGHRFWPDDLSLLDSPLLNVDRLHGANQVTDTYLLALAVRHGGRLASFDRRLVTSAVRGGETALHLID